MNIYSSAQIRAWDAFTIAQEPIATDDLMERAARALFDWIKTNYPPDGDWWIFCGRGNNGGDGMALARLLYDAGYAVRVFVIAGHSFSAEALVQYERLHKLLIPVEMVEPGKQPAQPAGNAVLVDALLGTGLSRPVEGPVGEVVHWLNTLPNKVISIDMPSGLPADTLPANDVVVRADITLTFQCPRYAFFMPENEQWLGTWQVLDIALHSAFLAIEKPAYYYADAALIAAMLPANRNRFAHKGHFGHAVLGGGNAAMMGAVQMAAGACLRSGAGLLSVLVPDEGRPIMQTAVPEAMCFTRSMAMHHAFYAGKKAIGVGMGWEQDDFHARWLQWLIHNIQVPLVIDATAIALLARNPEWLAQRPPNAITVITPHGGEFTRLCGQAVNSQEQLEQAKSFALRYHVFVILKGAYTRIITPGGLVYFNSTGNPGMAKGGSGDVLAGLLTGLLAQNMPPAMACLLGVYMHGLAGDIAAATYSQPGMTAMDIMQALPQAWLHILSAHKAAPAY